VLRANWSKMTIKSLQQS